MSDDELATEADFAYLEKEINKAVRSLERQVERVAEQRARADAAVMQDIERRLQIIEKNAQVPISPRERNRQREEEKQWDKVARLHQRADALEHTDPALAQGYRELAAEKEL